MTAPMVPDAPDAAALRVDRTSPAYDRLAPKLRRCRDVHAGTDAVRAAGAAYLRKFPGEDAATFQTRVDQARYVNLFEPVTTALAGMVFQQPPTLGADVPATIAAQLEAIDGRARHWHVVARELFEDALVTGRAALLVDYPRLEPGAVASAADEARLGARPLWIWYRAEDVYRATFARVGPDLVCTRVVLREVTEEEDAEGWTTVETFRDLRLAPDGNGVRVATATTWTIRDGGEPAMKEAPSVIRGAGGTPFTRLPVAFLLTGKARGPFECDPPLLALADVTLSHYATLNQRENLAELVAFPVPVRKGYRPPPPAPGASAASGTPVQQLVGPDVVMDVPTDGDFAWVAPGPDAFAPLREMLAEKKQDAGALGLAFLSPDTRAAETAEAKRLDAAAQNASLAAAARQLQDVLETALAFHAQYVGAAGGGTVTVTTDFDASAMPADIMNAYTTAYEKGALPRRAVLTALQAGKRLPDDADLETLDLDAEAGQAAARDLAALEAAARGAPDPMATGDAPPAMREAA